MQAMTNLQKTNAQKLDIQVAGEADIANIVMVYRITRAHNLSAIPNIHSLEEDLDYFSRTIFKKNTVVAAKDNGKIVGFCAFRKGWVDHLYVLPEHQGRNIGKSLLNQAKEANAQLRIWVFQKNEAARKFYEKNGFTLIKQTDGQTNEEHEPDALYQWSQ